MSRLSQQLKAKLNRAIDGIAEHIEQETGPDWRDYNEAVVADWKGKPRFNVEVRRDKSSIEMTVRPTGEHRMKWVWVDQGTGLHGPEKKAYKIPKVADGRLLVFQTGYRPRTMPVANFAVGSGTSVGPTVFTRKQITHPGIEPRHFTREQADEVRRTLPEELKLVIIRAIKR